MRLTILLVAVALAACATAPAPVPADAPVNPALERRAIRATAPERPLRVIFDWSLRERDARFAGRGVARIAPPYRARLDLFGPRGSTVLAAAVVEGELRLPPGVREGRVPPPALLWSTIGVFRPPAGGELVAATREDGRIRLVYAEGENGDLRWTFELEEGRLRYAAFDAPRRGRLVVELEGEAGAGLPATAVYRDYGAYRELTLTPTEVDPVDGYPPEIFAPGA